MNITNVNGEVAITGISSRFPKSNNLEEFAKNLYDGVNMVTDENARWPDGLYGLHSYGG